jgi:hypothetical protein
MTHILIPSRDIVPMCVKDYGQPFIWSVFQQHGEEFQILLLLQAVLGQYSPMARLLLTISLLIGKCGTTP